MEQKTGITLDTDQVVERIKEFIRGKINEANATGVVVGLSGGIDSTLSATLAVEALGEERVEGLIMPGKTSDETHTKDAHELANSLGIEVHEVNIEPIVDAFREALPDASNDREAIGNVRARTRMVLEYLKANAENRLVLGTGNRTELLIGYYTKYGDGGVDILPIGGLYKTEVREVARYLGVDEKFITKTPTAGLWEGQTDEGELGAPYDTIDRILVRLIDRGMSVEETAKEVGVDVDLVEGFERMHERSEHKRKMPPYPEIDRT